MFYYYPWEYPIFSGYPSAPLSEDLLVCVLENSNNDVAGSRS